jgi:hypothetical protein
LPAANGEPWQILKGDHFIIRYRADPANAETVLRQAEECYQRIGETLGIPRYDGFWLWERRVSVVLFQNRREFIAAARAPAWAAGKASYSQREIMGVGTDAEFIAGVLPHEMTHLIFREYIGFDAEAPRWLDEGVAQSLDPRRRAEADRRARALIRSGRLIPLRTLTSLDIRQERNPEAALDYYAEAASLVGFLIASQGGAAFVRLCRQLRTGRNLDEALQFTYPISMRTIAKLEQNWIQSLKGSSHEPE